jgi:hypothetical protein
MSRTKQTDSERPPESDAKIGAELDSLRDEIDAVDREILDRLNTRATFVQRVESARDSAATSAATHRFYEQIDSSTGIPDSHPIINCAFGR